jgi:hypothetical protein
MYKVVDAHAAFLKNDIFGGDLGSFIEYLKNQLSFLPNTVIQLPISEDDIHTPFIIFDFKTESDDVVKMQVSRKRVDIQFSVEIDFNLLSPILNNLSQILVNNPNESYLKNNDDIGMVYKIGVKNEYFNGTGGLPNYKDKIFSDEPRNPFTKLLSMEPEDKIVIRTTKKITNDAMRCNRLLTFSTDFSLNKPDNLIVALFEIDVNTKSKLSEIQDWSNAVKQVLSQIESDKDLILNVNSEV